MVKGSFTIRLSEEQKELLKKQSENDGRTQTGQIVWLINRRQKEIARDASS